jgi:hypothetical protein
MAILAMRASRHNAHKVSFLQGFRHRAPPHRSPASPEAGTAAEQPLTVPYHMPPADCPGHCAEQLRGGQQQPAQQWGARGDRTPRAEREGGLRHHCREGILAGRRNVCQPSHGHRPPRPRHDGPVNLAEPGDQRPTHWALRCGAVEMVVAARQHKDSQSPQIHLNIIHAVGWLPSRPVTLHSTRQGRPCACLPTSALPKQPFRRRDPGSTHTSKGGKRTSGDRSEYRRQARKEKRRVFDSHRPQNEPTLRMPHGMKAQKREEEWL